MENNGWLLLLGLSVSHMWDNWQTALIPDLLPAPQLVLSPVLLLPL